MDEIQLKRPSLLFHLLGIGLFGSVLIRCKPALALNGDCHRSRYRRIERRRGANPKHAVPPSSVQIEFRG